MARPAPEKLHIGSIDGPAACRQELRDMLALEGIEADLPSCGGDVAALLGRDGWAALTSSVRRRAAKGLPADPFDEALDVDALDRRLEGQVEALLHRRPALDPSAAIRIVARLRVSADPGGPGRTLGPSAGARYAYRGYDDGSGTSLFCDARPEAGNDLVEAANWPRDQAALIRGMKRFD